MSKKRRGNDVGTSFPTVARPFGVPEISLGQRYLCTDRAEDKARMGP